MKPILHVKNGDLDVALTHVELVRTFPDLEELPIERLIRLTEATLEDVRPSVHKRPQHLWLFFLAGRLKGVFDAEAQRSEKTAMQLSPFAWLFAELLAARGITGSKNRIDWSDREAVQIEWLNAWVARKLPVGSSALSDAYEAAQLNPLGIEGNKYMALIINMGFALQVQTGDFPFILPVNGKVAALLKTTMPTIGSSVAKAIRDGYFIVHEAKYSASARKARMFHFNFAHSEFKDNALVQSHFTPQAKLKAVFARAAEILMARPDPVLAEIASSAGFVNNSYAKEQLAVVWRNGEDILPPWPGVGYFSDDVMALPVDDFAQRLVVVLDELDERGMVKRPTTAPNDRTREDIEDEERERLQRRFDSDEFYCFFCREHAKLKSGFLLETVPSGQHSPRFLYSNEECCTHLREKADLAFAEAAHAIEARSPKSDVASSGPSTGAVPSTARAAAKRGAKGPKRN